MSNSGNSSNSKKYDLIIVGAGPAGIFAALEIAREREERILIIEKGPDLSARQCPINQQGIGCTHCNPCRIVSGWGGAGAFSDGKLTLTPEFGGWLHEYLAKEDLVELISYVDETFLHYGAPTTLYGTDQKVIKDLQRRAATADLSLIPSAVRHLGTERCTEILHNIHQDLDSRIDMLTGVAAREILVGKNGRVTGIITADGTEYQCQYLVVAPGRDGSQWFAKEAKRLGLDLMVNPVDVGVRVEVPAVVLEDITEKVYESKLIYYSKSFDDQVRTFCVNPYGEVVIENNSGVLTVNGHSYGEKKTDLTNFALLVSKNFTEPFKEPITYGRYIASLANLLSGGVLVQRLGDLLAGRRSTEKRMQRGMVQPSLREATPGDLSLVLPYRHLTSILEMLEAMDQLAPGVFSRHTLLYGVEVKFYSSRLTLTPELETRIGNMFAIGDGAGVTRGLVQAASSGVLVAREIVKRMG